MARSMTSRVMARSTHEDELHRKFRALIQELREIEEELESGSMIDVKTATNFTDRSAAERMAMIYAVDAVNRFLTLQGATCKILFQLSFDLQQLRFGVAAGPLSPERPLAGRKKDSPEISYLKGRIAGIARLQVKSGQPRNDAAAWIARKIPVRVASRLSSKPIKASTVKEWIDQYDCGANILDVFASQDKRKDFESCFPAPTGMGKDEDEDSCDRFARQLTFWGELVPEHKRRNSIPGIMGFMFEICEGYLADGRPLNFAQLLADLEELPSDGSAETDL
jgi:hypothetical protein